MDHVLQIDYMKNMVSRKHTILLTVLFAARAVFMVTVILSPPVVDVIEDTNVTLTCRVMNSSAEVYQTSWRENKAGALNGFIFLYPNGTCSSAGALNNGYLFAWNCERNSTFTLTLKGVKRNEHMKEWLCSGVFQLSNASRILVRVPVESVEMESHTQEKISIQENRSTTFECNTTPSRPIPAIFWFLSNPDPLEIINVTNEARQSPQAGESIDFAAVTSVLNYSFSRRFNGWSLYCQATNMPTQYVTSGKKLLDTMYPAEVGNLTETVAIEGSSINMTCPIIPGNPSTFTVKWKPGGDLGSSTSHVLYISNISRTDEDIYVCSVTTRMRPTYGLPTEQVNYGQFQLTVVYKARVTKFYIEMETDNNTFTVNETEDVTFFCYIDSKPPPDASIHNEVQILHVFSKHSLVYTRKNIQCTDFGIYICSGINYFNYGTPSEKDLTLYVNCSPRPSPFVELNEEVRCARNMPATLSFTALAYPEPGQTGFNWNYMNGLNMISLTNNSNTVISSSSVQSNLTIKNVTHADYGQYILKIMNRIDVYRQLFVIKPYDVPMPPVILNWTASETDVTITIKAGSDGGLTQLFHLRYSEATEENWIEESIKETLTDVFSHTVSGLFSGKTYRVIVYATNKLGNSTEDTTLVKTNDYLHRPLDTQTTGVSSNIGAFVGVGVGTFVTTLIIVVIVLTVYRRLRRNHTQNFASDVHDVLRQRIDTGIDSETSFTYESLNESKKERDLYSQLPASYEQLDQVTKEKNTYMTIETSSHDISDYVNIKI